MLLLLSFYSTTPQCSSVSDGFHGNDHSERIVLSCDHRVNSTFEHFNIRIAKLETQMYQLNETMKQYYISIDRTRAIMYLDNIMKELFIRQAVVHSSVKELEKMVVISINNHNTSDKKIENMMRNIDDIHGSLLQVKQIRNQISSINTIITSLLGKISDHILPLSTSLHSVQTQLDSLHNQSQRMNASIKHIDSSIRYYQHQCRLEPIYEEIKSRIIAEVQKQITNFTSYSNISVVNDEDIREIDVPYDTPIAVVSTLTKSRDMIPSLDYALSTAGGRILRGLTSSSYFPVEYHLDTILKRILFRTGFHSLVCYVPAWTGLSLYKMLQLDEMVITPQVVLSLNKYLIPCWPMQVWI